MPGTGLVSTVPSRSCKIDVARAVNGLVHVMRCRETVQVMFIIASGSRALDDIGIIDQWCVSARRISTTVSNPKLERNVN